MRFSPIDYVPRLGFGDASSARRRFASIALDHTFAAARVAREVAR